MSITAAKKVQSAIGYTFKDPRLLERALAHRASEKKEEARDSERLSWIGDALVNWTVSENLFKTHAKWTTEQFHNTKKGLVDRDNLGRIATEIGLEQAAIIGPSLASNPVTVDRHHMLAEILEAVLGAVYMESGIEAAEKSVLRILQKNPAPSNNSS